jgi:4-methyl-5(b-hydroxyethyl)-thiazole monophosphate biosynthesis
MQVAILVYDTCVQFEVVLAALFLKQKAEIVTYGLEMREHESEEGFLVRPHRLLEDMEPDKVDLFIIPGGDPESILGNMVLGKKLRGLNARGKVLAAICGGPVHLGKAGVLQGRCFTSSVYNSRPGDFEGGTFVDEDVVEDGNVITALPNAYVDFALTLARRMKVFIDEEDEAETIRVFREFQRG